MTITPASPNLNIEHLQPNAAQPEVVVDAAIDALDAKITAGVSVVVGHTNAAVLTQDDQAAGSIFMLIPGGSPGPTADCTVTFAAFGMGLFAVHNKTAFPATLQVAAQPATPPVLQAGLVGIFYSDGVNVVSVAGGSAGGLIAGLPATEDLAAGDLVNVFTSGGAAKMQKANATDASKPVQGFVLSIVLTGNSGVWYGGAQINNGLSGLTPGAVYYLDTTAGGVTDTPPSSSGNIVQEVGVALNATTLAFFPKGFVQL
jgi:hypothetical protein